MSNAKRCDRCGKYYESYNTTCNSGMNTIVTKRTDYNGDRHTINIIDLCPECCESYKNWFKEINITEKRILTEEDLENAYANSISNGDGMGVHTDTSQH